MTSRPAVPINVERSLWAESMGVCMNPECNTNLIGETSIGDMAHIIPHADGGPPTVDNLLMLCRNCHRQVDGVRDDGTEQMLRLWKRNRNLEIRLRFSSRCQNFRQLQDLIVPLLERNADIFREYGPGTLSEDLHHLWVRFEPELISNNARILALLKANHQLLHPQNNEIVTSFDIHVKEFNNTRGDYRGVRSSLFPEQLLSIFGVSPARETRPVSNLSALQNLIKHLTDRGHLQDIRLEPDPVLTYTGPNGIEALYLDDMPRVSQVYWTGNFYRPVTTELRLESLIFFAKWLANNEIQYSLTDPCNLAEMLLCNKYAVVLAYEYCLTVSTLYQIRYRDNLIVVNLYNWNGECITDEARDYAAGQGFHVLTQGEFFRFAHQNLI